MNKDVSKYARQCAVFKMKGKDGYKTLAVNANLSRIDEKNEKDKALPLDFESGFSKFEVSIIQNNSATEVRTGMSCNLSIQEMTILSKDIEHLAYIHMKEKLSNTPSTDSPDEICYSTNFVTGRFNNIQLSGLSVAQAYAKIGKEGLLAQKDFLKKGAEKYENNRKLIAAIDNCIALADQGKFVEQQTSGTTAITLLESRMKTRQSVKDSEGRVLVCELDIVVNFARNIPVTVTVRNYYGQLQVEENGQQKVINGTPKEENSINMGLDDLRFIVSRCMNTLSLFEATQSERCFRISQRYTWSPEQNNEQNDSSDDNNIREFAKVEQKEGPPVLGQIPKPNTSLPTADQKPTEGQFTFHPEGELKKTDDGYTINVKIDGFNQTGLLVFNNDIIPNLRWFEAFKKRMDSGEGCKNLEANATREKGVFTIVGRTA